MITRADEIIEDSKAFAAGLAAKLDAARASLMNAAQPIGPPASTNEARIPTRRRRRRSE